MNITIASLPDREKIVAELWQGNDHFAEINQEGEILESYITRTRD